jgi:hypothetical protein
MTVVPLTLSISLCLVFTFVVFFLREQARGRLSSAERDSLLPLAEEIPQLARVRIVDIPVNRVVGKSSRDQDIPPAIPNSLRGTS